MSNLSYLSDHSTMYYFESVADKSRKASLAKKQRHSVGGTKLDDSAKSTNEPSRKPRRFTTASLEVDRFLEKSSSNKSYKLDAPSSIVESSADQEYELSMGSLAAATLEGEMFNPALLTRLIKMGDVDAVKSLGLRPDLEQDVSIFVLIEKLY